MQLLILRTLFFYLCCVASFFSQAQDTLRYQVTFPNAIHHECQVGLLLQGLPDEPVTLVMSSASPGRYANHQFAKNMYNIFALNIESEELPIKRIAPSEWEVYPVNGYLKIIYTLYANHPDGTYSGLDRAFAHLNMPASFMWVKGMENKPIRIEFDFHESKNWKVATQLIDIGANRFFAPNLHYFMDSPTVLADFDTREFTLNDHGVDKKIKIVFNPVVNKKSADLYTEMIQKIVMEQRAIFGELPDFDYGEYTFLCNYDAPYIGDGMEHRNSTMLTSSNRLNGNELNLISTVSHEFFHSWNIERLRPKSLEPFDYTKVNMSNELWFGEGFTEYYGDLSLKRSGIYDETAFFNKYNRVLNYVLNSPGTGKHSLVQMSQMAPFTDASSFVDPTNFQNTFTSYYYYGAAIAFALDMTLRSNFEGLSLDGYMTLLWQKYGVREIPYTTMDLRSSMAAYTGNIQFSYAFFEQYIEGTEVPEFNLLLNKFGYELNRQDTTLTDLSTNYFGIKNGELNFQQDPKEKSTFYVAGLNKGDIVHSINGNKFDSIEKLGAYFSELNIGSLLGIKYSHHGKEYEKNTVVKPGFRYLIHDLCSQENQLTERQKMLRKNWLESKIPH